MLDNEKSKKEYTIVLSSEPVFVYVLEKNIGFLSVNTFFCFSIFVVLVFSLLPFSDVFLSP